MGGHDDKNRDDRVRRFSSNQADASDVTTSTTTTSRPTLVISNDIANAAAHDATIRRTVGAELPPPVPTRRSRRSNGTTASARLAHELQRALSGASLTGLVEAYIQRSISNPKMAKRDPSSRRSTSAAVDLGQGENEAENDGPSDHCVMLFGSLNDDDDDDDGVIYV